MLRVGSAAENYNGMDENVDQSNVDHSIELIIYDLKALYGMLHEVDISVE